MRARSCQPARSALPLEAEAARSEGRPPPSRRAAPHVGGPDPESAGPTDQGPFVLIAVKLPSSSSTARVGTTLRDSPVNGRLGSETTRARSRQVVYDLVGVVLVDGCYAATLTTSGAAGSIRRRVRAR